MDNGEVGRGFVDKYPCAAWLRSTTLVSARRGHQERRSRVRELALAATIIEPDGSSGSFAFYDGCYGRASGSRIATTSKPSMPLKSSGSQVKSGRSFAIAIAAIIAS